MIPKKTDRPEVITTGKGSQAQIKIASGNVYLSSNDGV